MGKGLKKVHHPKALACCNLRLELDSCLKSKQGASAYRLVILVTLFFRTNLWVIHPVGTRCPDVLRLR